MKRLFQFALLALLCGIAGRANATWAVVHDTSSSGNCGSSAATCSLTIPSTTAGNKAILWATDDTSTIPVIASVAFGGSGTMVVPAGCSQTQISQTQSISCAYSLSLPAAQTSVVVTWSTNTGTGENGRLRFIEVSSTGTASLDTTNARTQGGFSTNLAGVALTLSGTNDFIMQGAMLTSTPSNITTYTNFSAFPVGGATATLLNSASGTAPTWTNGNAEGVLAGIALSEQVAAGGSTSF